MRKSDFLYPLPRRLIAQRPLPQRSASRLLCLQAESGRMEDRDFTDFPELLRPGDLLVLNDTKVLPARLWGRKASGGRVEILVERALGREQVLAQLRASRAPRAGSVILLEKAHRCRVAARRDDLFVLEFDGDAEAVLQEIGHIPLPPYIRRADEAADAQRYQTVFARRPGAVAAPTAGLHFDLPMLAGLEAKGVDIGFVTLHVGAGTFQPVRGENLEAHRMHQERFEVSEALVGQVESVRRRGARVVAVGTTAVRALETAALGGALRPMQGETDLFIRPGFRFSCVDLLVTNFHLPESTLLMLVCAFAGHREVLAAYRHAVERDYRFFSYGDAMFLTRKAGSAMSEGIGSA